MATGGRRASTDVTILKQRVKELEDQVADYKRRLEGLRKAKNTTVVKTQKELVEVNTPNLGQRTNETKVADLQRLLTEEKLQRKQDLENLQKKHQDEIARLQISKSDKEDKVVQCDHETEIDNLHGIIQALEATNAAILIESNDLHKQVDDLLHKLSVKEAEWCDTEEKLNHKLKLQWGEKYREWMERTEQKIGELQQANTLLQGYLKKDKPQGDV